MRLLTLTFILCSSATALAQQSKPEAVAETPSVVIDERCEGNACDAYLPALDFVIRYEDVKGQKRLNSVLGGVSGTLIGDEIAGAPGAVILGAFGLAAGHRTYDKGRMEADAKRYEETYLRGDNIFYNPVNRLPDMPHWLMAGPARPNQK